MPFKKAKKDILDLTKTGLVLGAGGVALGGLGGEAPANASAGLVSVSRALPAVGSVMGVGLVLGATKGLIDIVEEPFKKKKRRK